jgi:hypothetical protein
MRKLSPESVAVDSDALLRMVADASASKEIGPDLKLYMVRDGVVLTWISDELLSQLPPWAVEARPAAVRNDEVVRHYWSSPVDRVLLVALHDYMCKWLYSVTYKRFGRDDKYPTLEDYCKHMLKKSEWDFQDSSPSTFAKYCNYRVFGDG